MSPKTLDLLNLLPTGTALPKKLEFEPLLVQLEWIMKTVILAGGFGTRLAEETETKPKPMVEIGSQPILWHIMKHYSYYGFQEFVIALGYKGDTIRRYFLDYAELHSDIAVDLRTGKVSFENHSDPEPWLVHLIETGVPDKYWRARPASETTAWS